MTRTTRFASVALAAAAAVAACGSPKRSGNGGDDDGSSDSGTGSNPGSGSNITTIPPDCATALQDHSSIGCEYYAVDMDAQGPAQDACFAVFIANTSMQPVHIESQWNGSDIDLGTYAKLPVGNGSALTYAAYDPTAGLAPGKVAILFLAELARFSLPPQPTCPVPAAIGDDGQINGTGIGHAFHIATDQPVVAYQELPYGGGTAAVTGASLLLPTSSWGTNYIAVSSYDPTGSDVPPFGIDVGGPSYNFVAATEGTVVTITPLAAFAAGANGVAAGSANVPYDITLHRGEYLQLSPSAALTGSPVSATQPIGVFGGQVYLGIDRCCDDHGEQMIAPIGALGSEYVGAPHGDRDHQPETHVYRIVGAVDGTQLTYDPPGLGPATVDQGKLLEIRTTNAPFVVRSQDAMHPFSAFTYMTGGGDPNGSGAAFGTATGDPDFVRLVPPLQYLSHYVFFTDPTYPVTQLTIVRQAQNGVFKDVTLDCLSGPVTGWQPVGTGGQYQLAIVPLVDEWAGQGGCNNGIHIMDSAEPFGVWVWGWGDAATGTESVSYGYPAGENVQTINNVVIE